MVDEHSSRIFAPSGEWLDAIARLRADVAPAFTAAANTIRSRPRHLYHFTDCDGLIGIFKSKKLYASLATALNDASEITFGIDRAVTLIDAGRLRADHLSLDRVKARLTARQVEWTPYVVSFCETEDTALHWLHYGRSGTGVAITCESNALESGLFRLFPVIYREDDRIELFTSVVSTIDRVLHEYLPRIANSQARDMLCELAADIAADQFWAAAPLMKSLAYQAEREWRLIAFDPKGEGIPESSRGTGPTLFRVTAGRVVPYKECAINLSPWFEVVLGFSSTMQVGEPALTVLMQEYLERPIPVRRSGIPVRW